MKQRVISAVIMVAIIVGLFLLPAKISHIGIGVAVGLLAAQSYRELLGLKESRKKYPKYINVLGFICMELMVFHRFNAPLTAFSGINFMIVGLVLLVLLTPSIFDKKEEYTTKEAFYLAGTTIAIGLFFNLVMLIYNANRWELLYLLAVATMTDTFAMLIGCLVGKHKLIPDVSPKKSVEGSIAGSVVGTIISSILYYNIISSEINILVLILMTLVLTILGQLGDLFFSKIKRENKIKDFSNIMPGHGGILDRFDSLTFIVFGYVVIINIINLF